MFRFKELIELWKTANSLTQALEDSHVMLQSTHEMFSESVKTLRHSDNADLTVDIHKMDQTINKYEQQVRRKVLKHLAITGGVNMIPGLILTSIVIDIERIGTGCLVLGDELRGLVELDGRAVGVGDVSGFAFIETHAIRLDPALPHADIAAIVRVGILGVCRGGSGLAFLVGHDVKSGAADPDGRGAGR